MEKKYEYKAFFISKRGNLVGSVVESFETKWQAEDSGIRAKWTSVKVKVMRREVGEWEEA